MACQTRLERRSLTSGEPRSEERRVGSDWSSDVCSSDLEAAAAGDERARMSVWEVIQLLDGLPDTFGKTLADQWRTVDGSGDSGYGDLGHGGDGANVGRSHGRFAGCFSRHGRILLHTNQV